VTAKSALRTIAAAALIAAIASGSAAAPAGKPPAKPSDSYDELFARYLQQARSAAPSRPVNAWAWMTGLANDRRARHVNDLLTINVVESITASGSADSALAKASDASHAIPGLFGLEKKLPGFIDPTALVAAKSGSNFKGSGTTNRTGALTALLTARVAEVLPNGDLVVEGVREIEINGDLQVVVLSGVVRVTDVSPENIVPSTSVGQLRIRYFGRGLMKDSLGPGFLIRMLNKIF
jgi:flagellar L-ring protein precursor FlgH